MERLRILKKTTYLSLRVWELEGARVRKGGVFSCFAKDSLEKLHGGSQGREDSLRGKGIVSTEGFLRKRQRRSI